MESESFVFPELREPINNNENRKTIPPKASQQKCRVEYKRIQQMHNDTHPFCAPSFTTYKWSIKMSKNMLNTSHCWRSKQITFCHSHQRNHKKYGIQGVFMNEPNCKRLNAIKCETVLSRSGYLLQQSDYPAIQRSSDPAIHGKATHSTVTHSSNGCLPRKNALNAFLDGCRRRQMAVKLAPNGHNAHSITVELCVLMCSMYAMYSTSSLVKWIRQLLGYQATRLPNYRAETAATCNELVISCRFASDLNQLPELPLPATCYLLLATCNLPLTATTHSSCSNAFSC